MYILPDAWLHCTTMKEKEGRVKFIPFTSGGRGKSLEGGEEGVTTYGLNVLRLGMSSEVRVMARTPVDPAGRFSHQVPKRR